MSKVAITGMGIISAIGNSVEENLNALLSGVSGISTIENIDTNHRNSIKVGEIKMTNLELSRLLDLPVDNNFSRTALLGLYAAKQAVKNAGIENSNEYKTGLISATSVGGMDMTERFFYDFIENEENRRYILTNDAGDSSHKIADNLG